MRLPMTFALCVSASMAWAEPVVDVVEKLGASLPPGLALRDADGRAVRLEQLVRGDLPTVLVPSSYECPMLCGLLLRGLIDSLAKSGLEPGRDVRLLTVSFDPRDTPGTAWVKQASAFDALPASRRAGWPFLSGPPGDLQKLMDAVGYRVAYDADAEAYLHPAAIVVLTPAGRISRYLYGVEFPRRHLRLAVVEAAAGRQGSAFERILITCLRYDPLTRQYALSGIAFVEIGAALLAVGLVVLAVRTVGRELLAARRGSRDNAPDT